MPKRPYTAALLALLVGGCSTLHAGSSQRSTEPSLSRGAPPLLGRWEGVSSDGVELVLDVVEVRGERAKVLVAWSGPPKLKLLPKRMYAWARVLPGERPGLEWRPGPEPAFTFHLGPDARTLEGTHDLGRAPAQARLRRREGSETREAEAPFACPALTPLLTETRPQARTGLAEALLARARAEGTPLIEPGARPGVGCVTFLHQGPAREVSLAGDLNGWNAVQDELTRVEGTDLFFLSRELALGSRLDYKLVVDGEKWVLDPLNARTMAGGYGPNSHFWLPGYEPPPEVELRPDIPHGTRESFQFESKHLGNARTVTVYLPPGYAASTERYRVLYAHDGQDLLELGHVDRILDYLIHEGSLPPVIAVLVPPVERGKEYALDRRFERFFVEEVVPAIDARYRTVREPGGRAIAGISMGGNAALSLALRHPEVFGRCAAQSSGGPDENAFELLELLRGTRKGEGAFYLDVGTYESNLHGMDLLDYNRRLREGLKARGDRLAYQEVPEGHSWGNWRARLDEALRFFWGPGRSASP